jgi:hypothetical protein
MRTRHGRQNGVLRPLGSIDPSNTRKRLVFRRLRAPWGALETGVSKRFAVDLY